jgi:DeoR family glycerol-3-phosphate regulon repressor
LQNAGFTENQPTARQKEIVERVRQRGFVSIKALARDFDITSQTVRRDINALCAHGSLSRYHGGAGLPSTVENTAYQTRKVQNAEGKQRIGAAVARLIPDQASLFITLGTTTNAAARALASHRGLRVITNNLEIASLLCTADEAEVMVAGGVVRPLDGGVTGEAAADFFRNFQVDYALIGISGIEPDGTLLDFDYREVRLLRVIMANARKVYLLVDANKYGRNALVRVGNIADSVDALITDHTPPAPLAGVLNEAGIDLHVADA